MIYQKIPGMTASNSALENISYLKIPGKKASNAAMESINYMYVTITGIEVSKAAQEPKDSMLSTQKPLPFKTSRNLLVTSEYLITSDF